jgi:hypothetical protein
MCTVSRSSLPELSVDSTSLPLIHRSDLKKLLKENNADTIVYSVEEEGADGQDSKLFPCAKIMKMSSCLSLTPDNGKTIIFVY